VTRNSLVEAPLTWISEKFRVRNTTSTYIMWSAILVFEKIKKLNLIHKKVQAIFSLWGKKIVQLNPYFLYRLFGWSRKDICILEVAVRSGSRVFGEIFIPLYYRHMWNCRQVSGWWCLVQVYPFKGVSNGVAFSPQPSSYKAKSGPTRYSSPDRWHVCGWLWRHGISNSAIFALYYF